MNPIEAINRDRSEAFKNQDPNAGICFLALASKQGKASVRTLVLRDILDNRFSLFINQTSPKWQQLISGDDYELLLWYPTCQKQYRIHGTCAELDQELVRTNWYRRPAGSKLLDYVYKEMAPQSSFIPSRQTLIDAVKRLGAAYKIEDMQPPEQIAGVELVADTIEMLDLNREDRIHDRRLFHLSNDGWHSKIMIP